MAREHPYGVVGGTGFEKVLRLNEASRIDTPFGDSPTIYMGRVGQRTMAFLPRHGPEHNVQPHRVNYRANIWAMHNIGVRRIIATNAVGAVNPAFKPGSIVVPDDLIEFTKARAHTFFDPEVAHVDFTEPYCQEIRRALLGAASELSTEAWPEATYVCTEGPRYETAAEIRMYRSLGADVVGMTSYPEAVLARELGICYASVCIVSNMAAGLQERVTTSEVIRIMREKVMLIRDIVKRAVALIPAQANCDCQKAIEEARLEVKT